MRLPWGIARLTLSLHLQEGWRALNNASPTHSVAELKEVGGIGLNNLTQNLISSLDADRAFTLAQQTTGKEEPTKALVQQAQGRLIDEAVKPLATKPELRRKIVDIHKALEQTVDTVSKDELVAAGFDQAALDAARETIQSFEQFIAEHKDEITALQVLYSRPHSRRLTLADIKALAAAIEKPPRRWTPDVCGRHTSGLGNPLEGRAPSRPLPDAVCSPIS